MQHLILHCIALESMSQRFNGANCWLVGSVINKELLGLILQQLVCMKRIVKFTGRHVYFHLHEDFSMLCMCIEKEENN